MSERVNGRPLVIPEVWIGRGNLVKAFRRGFIVASLGSARSETLYRQRNMIKAFEQGWDAYHAAGESKP